MNPVGQYEVVRTLAGWHARMVAANRQIVFTSEVYKHRDSALHAVRVARSLAMHDDGGMVPVVDERP